MAATRTWLTTPVGESPADEQDIGERWSRGPRVPTEPRLPFRYRGAVTLAVVLAVVVGLTFALAPAVLDTQDPTFGGGGADATEPAPDPAFELPDDG